MANRENTKVRRQQIIEATLQIITEKGLGSFTTAEIARTIGISEATIFRHFASKKEIMVETMRYIQSTLVGGAKKIQVQALDPLAKLQQLIHFHLHLISSNRGLPQIVFWEYVNEPDSKIRQLTVATLKGYLQIIRQVVMEGIEQGIFKKELDLDTLTSAYLGLMQVTLMKSLLDLGQGSLKEQEQAIYDFIKGILTKT